MCGSVQTRITKLSLPSISSHILFFLFLFLFPPPPPPPRPRRPLVPPSLVVLFLFSHVRGVLWNACMPVDGVDRSICTSDLLHSSSRVDKHTNNTIKQNMTSILHVALQHMPQMSREDINHTRKKKKKKKKRSVPINVHDRSIRIPFDTWRWKRYLSSQVWMHPRLRACVT